MRKSILLFLLTFMVLLTFSGCAKKEHSENVTLVYDSVSTGLDALHFI